MSDVYSSPADYGLTPVAELELDNESYQFNIRMAWRHADGRLLTARDSGCSCPSPFETYTSLEQLDPVNVEELENEARNSNAPLDERDRFIRTVIEAQKTTA
jgi:hypothetical protein